MRRHKGFSLIELLIVVAIILIIAAIAIPNLMRSRISANEASAVSSLRQISTAQITYSINYPTVGFADTLTKLAEPPPGTPVSPNNAGLLDWVLGCAGQPCRKSGYDFTINAVPGTPIITSYTLTATPASPGQTGVRGFCSDQMTRVTVDTAGGTACTIPLQ
ncbi:MAG: prepilin-type N-terminal cleavage/methylation domain-containing protein [Terriglobales bacterium]